MITVTKRLRFCYGHRLPGYDGKCKNYHGHNSEVEVEFENTGQENVYPGMVVDFSVIKKVVEPILEELDHQDLNRILTGMNPTAENIAIFLVGRIKQNEEIGHALIRLRITETPDSWAEWRAT